MQIKRILVFLGLLILTLFLSNTVISSFQPLQSASVRTPSELLAQKKAPKLSNLPKSMWVEMGDNNRVIARTITEANRCPQIQIDRLAYPMKTRTERSEGFPVKVCEYDIPAQASSVRIAGQTLPLPRLNPHRIAVIGDTGCRLKGNQAQACNDPQQWPFPKLAQTIADWKPDLVIHVGDYLYREALCPKDNLGCAGSAAGDNWQAWDQDFFTPAASLSKVAPWLLARGNHELCARGGKGWFYFLDPRPQTNKCQDYSDLYKVKLGAVDTIVMDAALADDLKVVPEQVAIYEQQFQQLQNMAHSPTWLLVHRPIWGMGQFPGLKFLNYSSNQTLQAASKNHLPDPISLILSGHIHIFEIASFADGRPPQSITGNGGTSLDTALSQLDGQSIAGTKVANGISIDKFGFMTLESKGADSWVGTARGVDGSVQATCAIQNRQVVCSKR